MHLSARTAHCVRVTVTPDSNGVQGRGQGTSAGGHRLKNPVEMVGWSVKLSTAGG